MRRMSRTWVVGVMVLVSSAVAACGGDDGGGTTGATGGDATGGVTAATGAGATAATGVGGATLTIEGFAFQPSTLEIPGATTLTVTNNDGVTHTFTLDDGGIDQEIGGGQTVEVQVDVSGSAGYHCEIHPNMTGTLQVA